MKFYGKIVWLWFCWYLLAFAFVIIFCKWGDLLSIYKNRTVCLSDRLRVGMSNGRNANHVTLPAVCDHAALRPHYLFRSSAFGQVGVTAVPDRMHARMFTHMCKMRRRRGRGPAAACSL